MSKSKENYLQEIDQYSAHNYKPLPVVMSKGEGVWVWDTDGKKYLDCLSAYSALNQGHRHPKIIQALKQQADSLTLSSRAFQNDQMGPFLKFLCQVCEMENALPMNTGAEAVETAIKLSRKWGMLKKGVPEGKAEIIVCENNFHGRTVTIVSFSTEEQYRKGFGPFTPGFKNVEYGSVEAFEKAITPHTVAFLYEPIQGEGGVVIPQLGVFEAIAKICKKNNILMMADEIQTGLGRTGKMFCYQHEKNAKPDVLILGKALGGGVFPVSAVLASKEIMEVFQPGDHGSTFGGNPLGSAVAMASLQVLVDEKLPQRSAEMGAYALEKLGKIRSKWIKEIRGRGLMLGVELTAEAGGAKKFAKLLADKGVLVKDTREDVLRIAPPLIIQQAEIDGMIEKLADVLK